MSSKKIISFQIFRYHLLPLSQTITPELFQDVPIKNLKDLKENKNTIFEKIIQNLNHYIDSKNPLLIEHEENNFFLIKIAQKKSTFLVKNFKNIEMENEPFVYIIINNDKNVQKIAISDNKEAFSSPNVVKNILKELFIKGLSEHNLNIEIEELFKTEDFWKTIDKYKFDLKQIDFKYIKPNLANISSSLTKEFKEFANNTNSHESHIVIKAPENGILENINQKNEDINGLVNYISQGGGDIKLKMNGLTRTISTTKNPVTLKIQESSIQGPAEQVIKFYQTLLDK